MRSDHLQAPWVASVRSDWTIIRADRALSRVKREPRPEDGVITAFRDGEVTLRTNRRTEGFTEAFQEIGYQGIRRGDLVVHAMDAFAGAIGVSDSDGKASPVVHAYRENLATPRFAAYLLREASRAGFIQALAKGIRERSTSFDPATMKRVFFVLPKKPEQEVIADYLDRKTAQIDALIDKQRALIEKLRERQAAVTERAVQDGDWPIVPIGSLTTLIQTGPFGSQISADDYVDNGVYLINPAHLRDGVIAPAESVSVDEKTAQGLMRHRIKKGDIVVARRGELGRCAVASTKDEGSLCGTGSLLVRLRQNLVEPEFFAMAFSSRHNADHLLQQSVGSTMNNINAAIVSRTRVPLPELHVQRDVVQQVSREVARINTLIDHSGRLIELSQERRSALITAAVTGQIDVTEMESREEAA